MTLKRQRKEKYCDESEESQNIKDGKILDTIRKRKTIAAVPHKYSKRLKWIQ